MAELSLWEDVKEIVLSAIELPADDRSQFLANACKSDHELRAAVEVLLNISTRDVAALDNVRLGVAEAPPDLIPGTVVGNFRICAPLGDGGMGVVYLAQDERTDRKVALKLLSTRAQFNRGEHKVLAKLDHPFIATLYESGETTDGFQYLAMEYIDGLQLAEYCENNRSTVKQRLLLFKQICDGIQYAHQNFVVHRDLKPSNILVTPKGEPKILDFGIAKEMDQIPSNSDEKDLNPMTLPFASPEQRKGHAIGPTSDIYSLGILLCGLVTGRYPQTSEDVESSAMAQELPLPSSFVEGGRPLIISPPPGDVDRLQSLIYGDLDAIILKALQPDPTERYQTAAELGEDIRRHLAIEPVSARPASLRYRTRRFLRRRAASLSVITAIAIVFLVMSALLFSQYRRALRGERQASAQAERTRQVNRFVVNLLRRTNPFDPSSAPDASVDELLDQSSQTTKASLANYPDLKASLLSVLGEIFVGRGNVPKGKSLLENALTLQRRGPPDQALAETLQRYSVVLTGQGRYRDSETALAEAKEVLRKLGKQGDPVLESRILLGQAANSTNLGDYEAALQRSKAALAALRHSPGSFTEIASSLHDIGRVLELKDRDVEAENLLRQALSYEQRTPEPKNPYIAITLNSLAGLRYKRGDYAGARTMYLQALEVNRATLGKNSKGYALTLHNIAALDSAQGHYQEALEKFTQVVAILQKNLPPEHLTISTARNQLASCLIYLHEYDRAEKVFLDVLATEKATLPKGHPAIAASLNNLAYLYQDEGRLPEAQAFYQQAMDIFEKLVGRKSRPVATLLGNLGTIAQSQYDDRRAEADFREALEIARGVAGEKSPDTVNALINLSSLYISTGDLEKARGLVGEVMPIAEAMAGPTGRLTGSVYILDARLRLAQGDFEGAIASARKAKTILAIHLPPQDWRIAVANSVLGAALGESGNTNEAEQLLLHSLAALRKIKGETSPQAHDATDRLRLFYKSLGREEEVNKYQRK